MPTDNNSQRQLALWIFLSALGASVIAGIWFGLVNGPGSGAGFSDVIGKIAWPLAVVILILLAWALNLFPIYIDWNGNRLHIGLRRDTPSSDLVSRDDVVSDDIERRLKPLPDAAWDLFWLSSDIEWTKRAIDLRDPSVIRRGVEAVLWHAERLLIIETPPFAELRRRGAELIRTVRQSDSAIALEELLDRCKPPIDAALRKRLKLDAVIPQNGTRLN